MPFGRTIFITPSKSRSTRPRCTRAPSPVNCLELVNTVRNGWVYPPPWPPGQPRCYSTALRASPAEELRLLPFQSRPVRQPRLWRAAEPFHFAGDVPGGQRTPVPRSVHAAPLHGPGVGREYAISLFHRSSSGAGPFGDRRPAPRPAKIPVLEKQLAEARFPFAAGARRLFAQVPEAALGGEAEQRRRPRRLSAPLSAKRLPPATRARRFASQGPALTTSKSRSWSAECSPSVDLQGSGEATGCCSATCAAGTREIVRDESFCALEQIPRRWHIRVFSSNAPEFGGPETPRVSDPAQRPGFNFLPGSRGKCSFCKRADMPASIPTATYRFQFHKGFTFRDALALVPYLHDLGISDIYASPIFRATPGSTHGYDICDHNALNPEVGTREEFDQLIAALRHERGHRASSPTFVLANHMGIAETCKTTGWMDILENGPSSPYARFLLHRLGAASSASWKTKVPAPGARRSIRTAQVLGASGELRVQFEDGRFWLDYYALRLPMGPRSTQLALRNAPPSSSPNRPRNS